MKQHKHFKQTYTHVYQGQQGSQGKEECGNCAQFLNKNDFDTHQLEDLVYYADQNYKHQVRKNPLLTKDKEEIPMKNTDYNDERVFNKVNLRQFQDISPTVQNECIDILIARMNNLKCQDSDLPYSYFYEENLDSIVKYEDTDEWVNLKAKAYFKELLQRIRVKEEKFRHKFSQETARLGDIIVPEDREKLFESQFIELQHLKNKLNHFCTVIDKRGKINFEKVYLEKNLNKKYVLIPTKETINFNTLKEQIDIYHFYINHYLKNQQLQEKMNNYLNILKYQSELLDLKLIDMITEEQIDFQAQTIFNTETNNVLTFEHKMFSLSTEDLKKELSQYALQFGIKDNINIDQGKLFFKAVNKLSNRKFNQQIAYISYQKQNKNGETVDRKTQNYLLVTNKKTNKVEKLRYNAIKDNAEQMKAENEIDYEIPEKAILQDFTWYDIYDISKFQSQAEIYNEVLFHKSGTQNIHSWVCLLLLNNREQMNKMIDLKFIQLNDGKRPEFQVKMIKSYYQLLAQDSRNSIAQILSQLNALRSFQKTLQYEIHHLVKCDSCDNLTENALDQKDETSGDSYQEVDEEEDEKPEINLYQIWKENITYQPFEDSFTMYYTKAKEHVKQVENQDEIKRKQRQKRKMQLEDLINKYDVLKYDTESGIFSVHDYKGRKIVYDAVYFDVCKFLQLLQNHLKIIMDQIEREEIVKKGRFHDFTKSTIENQIFNHLLKLASKFLQQKVFLVEREMGFLQFSQSHKKDFQIFQLIEKEIRSLPRVMLNIDVFLSYKNEIEILVRKNSLIKSIYEFYQEETLSQQMNDQLNSNVLFKDSREEFSTILMMLEKSVNRTVHNFMKVQLHTVQQFELHNLDEATALWQKISQDLYGMEIGSLYNIMDQNLFKFEDPFTLLENQILINVRDQDSTAFYELSKTYNKVQKVMSDQFRRFTILMRAKPHLIQSLTAKVHLLKLFQGQMDYVLSAKNSKQRKKLNFFLDESYQVLEYLYDQVHKFPEKLQNELFDLKELQDFLAIIKDPKSIHKFMSSLETYLILEEHFLTVYNQNNKGIFNQILQTKDPETRIMKYFENIQFENFVEPFVVKKMISKQAIKLFNRGQNDENHGLVEILNSIFRKSLGYRQQLLQTLNMKQAIQQLLILFPLNDVIENPGLDETKLIRPNNIYDFLVNGSAEKFRIPKHEEITELLTQPENIKFQAAPECNSNTLFQRENIYIRTDIESRKPRVERTKKYSIVQNLPQSMTYLTKTKLFEIMEIFKSIKKLINYWVQILIRLCHKLRLIHKLFHDTLIFVL